MGLSYLFLNACGVDAMGQLTDIDVIWHHGGPGRAWEDSLTDHMAQLKESMIQKQYDHTLFE